MPFWVAIMYATPVMVMLTMPLKLCIPLKLVQQFIQGCKGHYHTAGVVHVSVRIRPANTACPGFPVLHIVSICYQHMIAQEIYDYIL